MSDVLSTFDHHVPSPEQVKAIERNRAACKAAAAVLLDVCPSSADRTAALRQMHEAMMTGNKAIILAASPVASLAKDSP